MQKTYKPEGYERRGQVFPNLNDNNNEEITRPVNKTKKNSENTTRPVNNSNQINNTKTKTKKQNIKPVHGNLCYKKKTIIKSNNGKLLICKKSMKHLYKRRRKLRSSLTKQKQAKCYDEYCWHKLSMKNKLMYRKKIKGLSKSKKII
jgi:hypothetical protein